MSPGQKVAFDRLTSEFGVPEEVATQIASNLDEDGVRNAKRERTASGILLAGFVWSDTPEGCSYWRELHNGIADEEDRL